MDGRLSNWLLCDDQDGGAETWIGLNFDLSLANEQLIRRGVSGRVTPEGDARVLATALEKKLRREDSIVRTEPCLELAGWRCLVDGEQVLIYPFFSGEQPTRYDLPDIIALLQQWATPRMKQEIPQLAQIKQRLNG